MTAYINYISYFLPEKIRTNEDISKEHPEWPVEKITRKVGIEKRHIAGENETASDLAYNAAELFFNSSKFDRNAIDYILFCTQSPDYKLPTTACILQDRLQIKKSCGAVDFNLGCSGYVYGLGLAKGLIVSGQAENVLLLTGETYSKYLSEKDKGNKTIFGDAGTATLISVKEIPDGLNYAIGELSYGTDGSQSDSLIVKNGGARFSNCDGKDVFDAEGNFISNDSKLFMNGKSIFDFTAFEVPKLIKANLEKNKLNLSQIDLVIFHQANEYMLRAARQHCGIDPDKYFFDIKEVGNTVSNSIPIAIVKAKMQGRLESVNTIMLTGFGVGLSMGSVIIRKNI